MRVTKDHAAAFVGLALLLMGCSGDATGPFTGSIRAIVITLGDALDRDPDGYTLSIDGGPPQALEIFGAVTIDGVLAGNHQVLLGGLASNCEVGGVNPRAVVVGSGGTGAPAIVPFSVSCSPKVGRVRVSVATTGSDPDPDGYFVAIEGRVGSVVPANGSQDFNGVHEGTAVIELREVAGNCRVDGANPRTVTVAFGGTAEVAFTIQCVAAGKLQVNTATSGTFSDPNGYDLEIRLLSGGSPSHQALPTSGLVTVAGLLGNYVLTVLDIAPNCDVTTPNPRQVTVSAGSPTPVSLDIVCETPREIAYVGVNAANADIMTVTSDGNGGRRLTTQPLADADPAWSPDGSRVAFTSERDGNSEIYVMNADGTNQVRLTTSASLDSRPAWSPDGTRIAFASARNGNTQVYVMNADGTNPVRLTNNGSFDSDPAWSPDGTRIAFSSSRDGLGGIWIMNADGTGAAQLTSNTRSDWQPAWSPDGTRIAFARAVVNNSDIYIVNVDGTGLRQLTHEISNAMDPAWSPDGRRIALGSVPGTCGWYDYCDPYILIVSTTGTPYSLKVFLASNPAWRP
jgi:WD40 repeat protein